MRIQINIGNASINVLNNEGETVYSAEVSEYSSTIAPEKLAECIANAAEQIGTAVAEVSAKLEAL